MTDRDLRWSGDVPLGKELYVLVQYASDLHREFIRRPGTAAEAAVTALPHTEAPVVVLAGDIDLGTAGVTWASGEADRLKKPILYVLGNHEYYGQMSSALVSACREAAGPNLFVLDRDELVIEGTRFLGCSLWTDFGLTGDPTAARIAAALCINDFRMIRTETGRLTPEEMTLWNGVDVQWLSTRLGARFVGPTVVVTHFSPTRHSAHPGYGLNEFAPAFSTNAEALIRGARVWIHGHTHSSVDYLFDECRVVSNQKGYPGELVPGGYDGAKTVEVT